MNIHKITKDILTGANNRDFDNGRVVCLLSFVVYYSLAIAAIFKGHPWSALDFASGIGGMAVAFGVNLRLKRSTEPK